MHYTCDCLSGVQRNSGAPQLKANDVPFVSLRERLDTSTPVGQLTVASLLAIHEIEGEPNPKLVEPAVYDRSGAR